MSHGIELRHHTGEAIATIVIDRPEKRNAITVAGRKEIERLFAQLEQDGAVRAVIVKGAGDIFTAGGDIAGFLETSVGDHIDWGEDVAAAERFSRPVIAAVDGFCFGAGLELALSCDIRVCTPRAEFAFPEVRLGMMPGSGGTQRLARLIGLGRAKDVILTGDRVPAQRALEWGIITRVVEPDELDLAAQRLAEQIAAFAPLAVRTIKSVMNDGRDAPMAAAIQMERKAYAWLRATEDYQEGARAFLEKRKPAFKGQ